MHGPIFFCWFGGIKVIFWQNARNQVDAFALLHPARTQKNEQNSSETKLSSNIFYFSFSCLEFGLNFMHCIFFLRFPSAKYFCFIFCWESQRLFFWTNFQLISNKYLLRKIEFSSWSSRPWSVGGSREWHCTKWTLTTAFARMPFFSQKYKWSEISHTSTSRYQPVGIIFWSPRHEWLSNSVKPRYPPPPPHPRMQGGPWQGGPPFP